MRIRDVVQLWGSLWWKRHISCSGCQATGRVWSSLRSSECLYTAFLGKGILLLTRGGAVDLLLWWLKSMDQWIMNQLISHFLHFLFLTHIHLHTDGEGCHARYQLEEPWEKNNHHSDGFLCVSLYPIRVILWHSHNSFVAAAGEATLLPHAQTRLLFTIHPPSSHSSYAFQVCCCPTGNLDQLQSSFEPSKLWSCCSAMLFVFAMLPHPTQAAVVWLKATSDLAERKKNCVYQLPATPLLSGYRHCLHTNPPNDRQRKGGD